MLNPPEEISEKRSTPFNDPENWEMNKSGNLWVYKPTIKKK